MSKEIAEALAKAKYSDLVHVTLEDPAPEEEESQPTAAKKPKTEASTEKLDGGASKDENANTVREILLTAKLDHLNGGFKWLDVSSTEDPIAKHLRTKFWIFPMLNDDRRTSLYDCAIKLAAQEATKRHKEDSSTTVQALDIGSGTGLLAMMSAKHLQEAFSQKKGLRHIKITSLEMSRPMAILARKIAFANGFQPESSISKFKNEGGTCETSIDIIEAHSCEFPPLSEPKAMFCTSELLDSGLLGEGWLPTMRDAWERHLHPDAVVVPQRARVYARVVEGISDYWGPYKVLDGFPSGRTMSLFTDASREGTLSDGSYDEQGRKHGVQVPAHVEKLFLDPKHPIKILSEALLVFEFDVSRKEAIPGPEGRSRPIDFVPILQGKAEGVIFWWELDMYPDFTYSTRPRVQPWQDHWHQCLYVFPQDPKNCVSLYPGSRVQLMASHTDSRLHFSIDDPVNNQLKWWLDAKHNPKESVPRDPVASPRRAWMLNNEERSRRLMSCVNVVLAQVGLPKSAVLDISDFPLCGMMAAMLGARHVTSLESSSTDLPYISAKVAQLTNGLVPEHYQPDNFLVARCHPEHLTTSVLAANTRSNIIVGEPYYEFLEGHAVQEALNFHNIVCMLKDKKVISREPLTMPCSARLFAQGIFCPDIAKAYGLRQEYGGFDHTTLLDYWSFDGHPISIPLHEYNFRPATAPVAFATLHIEQSLIEFHDSLDDSRNASSRPFSRHWPSAYADEEKRTVHEGVRVLAPFIPGMQECHAIAFWVEYEARTQLGQGKVFDDGGKYRAKAQVLILRTPQLSMGGIPVEIPIKWIDAV